MKKIQLMIGLAFAALAFSAVAATSAFAETLEPVWLVDGVAVGAAAVETLSETASLELEDLKGSLTLGPAKVVCSGLDVGTVEEKGKDLTTEILSLTGTKPPITCTAGTGCPSPATASPVGLPWTTQLFLSSAEAFMDLVTDAGKSVGWTVSCFGVSDACNLPEPEATLTNLGAPENDVTIEFLQAATCERGGAAQGLVLGAILVFVHEKTLAASEE